MEEIGFFERRRVPRYDDLRQLAWGSVAVSPACSACSLCVRICPANCLRIADQKAAMVDAGRGECLMCGACAAICPKGAVTCVKGYRFSGMFKTVDHGELKPPRL